MAKASEHWTTRAGFLLATIGSAVGLGSIWKFPYEVGENGGGGFVLFYLIGLAIVVAPLMLAEFAIGRSGQSDARDSIRDVARNWGASGSWAAVGMLGIATSSLILSFYSVIGGWALAYTVETILTGLPSGGTEEAQRHFDALLSSPVRTGIYHTLFMGFTAWIVGRGIASGIEQAAKVLMPLMAVLMVALAAYAMLQGDTAGTIRYMFHFDLERLEPRVMLEAVGLGFFSIGVGLAVMITYAAYAGREINLVHAAVAAIVSDTAISFLAGFAIFPIVFANGLDPASGPGLMFVTLPLAFAGMPLGSTVAFAFFLLLLIAAITSAISMLEMPVSFARDSYGWPRKKAALVSATVIWVVGFSSVFSFNLWREWFPLSAYPIFASSTFFDLLDHVTSSIMLPMGGFALAIFVGWALPPRFLSQVLELRMGSAAMLSLALRYLVPAAILAATLAPMIAR